MGLSLRLKVADAQPILRGRDHVWSLIRDMGVGATFTVSDIHGRSNARDRGTTWNIISGLEKAGLVTRVGEAGRPGAALYRVEKAPSERPRIGGENSDKFGRRQRNMWTTIRAPIARNGFSARDVMAYASTDDAPVRLATARQFIGHLERAGYLLDAGRDESGARRWRLKPSMNTGPKPPAVLSARVMFDRNRNQVVGDVVAEERQP